jgi:threonyl-tRNA synthetase
VRRFHQDDGHIFCRPTQIEEEIRSTLEFVRVVYGILRLGPYRLVLSTRPADHYIGSPEDWEQAEDALKNALDACGQSWTLNEGDGAFYGPKIDIILKDSDGKEHQTATIQLDFQLPKRFELEYQAPAPQLEQRGETTTDPELLAVYGPVRPVLIHRAVLGSVERLMALLIEHYDGKWPFWLNPRQGIILTVNNSEPVVGWARRVQDILLGTVSIGSSDAHPASPIHPSELTVDLDDSPRSLQSKVREAKSKGYGVIIVIGPRNVSKGCVTVDASGIPSADGSKMVKDLEMTPEGVLRFMQTQVESY